MRDLVQLYRSIKSGRYQSPCSRIELLLAPGYHTKCFEGSGILRAVPQTGIEVVMVGNATRECLLDLWPHGEAAKEWQWYQIKAWDSEGREWVGTEWVRPKIRGAFNKALSGRSEVELTCVLSSISTHDIDQLGLSVRDEPKEQYEFIVPSVGNLWWSGWKQIKTEGGPEGETLENRACFHQCEIEGVRIVLEEGDEPDSVAVRISADGNKLPPFIDVQVLQGLQILTARMLNFGIQYRRGQHQRVLRIVGPVLRPTKSGIPPPYHIEAGEKRDHYWGLFEAFVAYLLRQELNPFFHPFIETLLLVMDASTRSWDTYSLTLAVGVESVLLRCASGNREDADETISQDDVDRLRKHIDSFEGNDRAKKRVLGFLARLGEWGTTDRLRKLQRLGIVAADDVRAWQELRNPAAHGDRKRSAHGAETALDMKVLTMLYKIILREAGYSGPINSAG